MNIENIGIDLVEIKRIQKIGKEKLAKRILSPSERQIYINLNHFNRQLTFLAGRWAAKEALFKVFSTKSKNDDICNIKSYCDFSILNHQNGSPYLDSFIFANQIMLSITHTSQYALALAILKCDPISN